MTRLLRPSLRPPVGSKFAYLDQELDAQKAIVANICSQILRLNAQLRVEQAKLAQLRENRAENARARARSRSFADLPGDILSIVLNLIANHRELYPYHIPAREITRAALVCRHWHAIALATPTCWAHVRIPPLRDDTMHMSEDQATQMVDKLLERSAGAPISVEFMYIDQPQALVYNDLRLRLDAHAHRWASFKITLERPQHDFLRLFTRPLPILKEVQIQIEDAEDMAERDWPFFEQWAYTPSGFLADAPQLQVCVLKHVPMSWHIEHPPLYPSLRRLVLSLATWSVDELRKTLLSVPALEELELWVCKELIIPARSDQPIVLPRLLNLLVEFYGAGLVAGSLISTPALRTVEIVRSRPTAKDWPRTESFLSHCTHLESAIIRNRPGPDMPLSLILLRSMPSLRQVKLYKCVISGLMCTDFSDPVDPLWPQLAVLEISDCDMPVRDSSFLDVLALRMRQGQVWEKLERLFIDAACRLDRGHRETLRQAAHDAGTTYEEDEEA